MACRSVLEQEQYAFLLASTDVTTWLISEHRERFEGLVRLVLPDRETVRACLDKSLLIEESLVRRSRRPGQRGLRQRRRGPGCCGRARLPVIVKSARSFIPAGAGFRRMPVRLVTDPEDLADALTGLESPFIVQRYERGGTVVSCSGAMTPDGLLGFSAVRWQRRWPVDEGATSYCRTIAPPQGLAGRVEQLLASVGFWGIFELELLELQRRAATRDRLQPAPVRLAGPADRRGRQLPGAALRLAARARSGRGRSRASACTTAGRTPTCAISSGSSARGISAPPPRCCGRDGGSCTRISS